MENKIAVIFHGIVGGMDDRNGVGESCNISECFKTIKYNLLDHFDCDIFIHSWSIDQKDIMLSIYNPVSYLFEKQEYFNFKPEQISEKEAPGQAFRAISKYTSLKRAIEIKEKYEKEHNINYKWVVVLRFDLVIFNKINIDAFDNDKFYVCYDPYWEKLYGFASVWGIIHYIILISNSLKLKEFSNVVDEAQQGIYNPANIHEMMINKLKNMYNNDKSKVVCAFRRYTDMEIYRFVIKPGLNHKTSKSLGSPETTARFNELITDINKIK